MFGISGPTDADPIYRESVREAVTIALDYALDSIEYGEGGAPPPPAALLIQARMAARSGVRLDTVLRRYLAGYSLLGDALIAEAHAARLSPSGLQQMAREHATVLDRFLAAVSDEFSREVANRPTSGEERRLERVKRLLAGEQLDTSEFEYEFDGRHVGVIVGGDDGTEVIRHLAGEVDCRPLVVRGHKHAVWGWLGSRRAVETSELTRAAGSLAQTGAVLAFGEPAKGLSGWRLTHGQASAAFSIAVRSESRIARYADVAILASVLRDDVGVKSLRQLYLAPLATGQRGDGNTLRSTLRVYFEAERNAASAAAALGVSRQTITNRLRAAEKRLKCGIGDHAAAIEAALQLEELSLTPDPE